MRAVVPLIVCVLACGRVSFEPLGEAASDGGVGGGPDAPPAASACATTHASALFCDSYEDPAMAKWSYMIVDEGRSERTTATFYRGGASLECETNDVAAYKAARWGVNDLFNELAAGDLYARAYYWLDPSSMITDQLSLMVVGYFAPPYESHYVMLMPGKLVVASPSMLSETNLTFPTARWVCLELHVAIDPAAGFAEVFLDGTRVHVSPIGNTQVAGGYTNMDVGVHYATTQQAPVRLWVDEVVADTAPIGCD